MRIALSLLAFRPGRIGGAETYVRELVRRLPAAARGDTLTAVMDRDVAAGLETPGFRRVVVPAGDRALVAARVAEACTPWRARRIARAFDGSDVALFPQQSIFPLEVRPPAVLTVHDLQHLAFPENFGVLDRTFRALAYPRSLSRATRIVAISHATARDLVERCGVEPARIEVIPHGVELDGPTEVAPWTPGAPFLYYPAATHAHKGHDRLLCAAAALRARGAFPWRLVFTGERTKAWLPLARLVRALGLEDAVVHRGFVSRADVLATYAGADAVVFPTRFEGFGIPVLEAVERGKKVVVSRLPIFDELGVPARWQVDFDRPEELAAALAQPGPTVLEKRPWTWDEAVRATVEALRSAAAL